MKQSSFRLFNLILLCLASIVWIAYSFMHFSNYTYRYPVIADIGSFTSLTLVNLVFPITPIVLGVVFAFNKQHMWSSFCCILFVPIISWSFLRGTAEILYSPTVYSYTDNPAYFGVYDEQFEMQLHINPVPFFPEEIPDDVCDVQYCYYHEYASGETTYLAISWRYENTVDYFCVVDALVKNEPFVNNRTYLFTDGFYDNAVLVDEAAHCIAYVIASGNVSLPNSMEEVFILGFE